MGPKWAPNSWGLPPRPPFSRPSASTVSAFGLQIYGPERAQGLWAQTAQGPSWLLYPISQVPYFFIGSNFLAIHLNFWRLDLDYSDRVNMSA